MDTLLSHTLYVVLPLLVALFLDALGRMARRRREDARLGDLFWDAFNRDRRYRMIILQMIALFLMSAAYVYFFYDSL